MQALRILLLLGLANLVPILTARVLGRWFAVPLDGGLILPDGRPLFGPGKTLRGVLASILCTAGAASLLAMDAALGAALGAGAMGGDLLASFCKRRLGLTAHARAVGLDQIPEVLLPLLLLRPWLSLQWREVGIVVVVFVLLDVLVSRVLFALRIRKRPY
jgi:CDP-2,3-bis-(O-geranylgeranyl)-sn-glycerol synthase